MRQTCLFRWVSAFLPRLFTLFHYGQWMALAAERKQSLGYDWHPECLRCEECAKRLNPGQHAEVMHNWNYASLIFYQFFLVHIFSTKEFRIVMCHATAPCSGRNCSATAHLSSPTQVSEKWRTRIICLVATSRANWKYSISTVTAKVVRSGAETSMAGWCLKVLSGSAGVSWTWYISRRMTTSGF